MELGSEYDITLSELTIKKNNIFGYLSQAFSTVFFDSGRSALKHIASHLKKGCEVLLPEYICESVSNCFDSEGVIYYKIEENFSVNLDDLKSKISERTQVIFLMHYFGSVQPEWILNEIRRIADSEDILIVEDTTHSIFSSVHTIGDYQICSIRKWMPIAKGGVLYFDKDVLSLADAFYPKDLDNEKFVGMILKNLFLKGSLDCNSTYRMIFSEAEKRLDVQGEVFLISDFSNFIASCIDINEIIKKRVANYKKLYNRLKERGIYAAIDMDKDQCPFVFLLRVPERDAFRKYLMDNKIYCAVHWPFDGLKKEDRSFANKLSEELISLPIDQRYGEDEINYMADAVLKYGGNLY